MPVRPATPRAAAQGPGESLPVLVSSSVILVSGPQGGAAARCRRGGHWLQKRVSGKALHVDSFGVCFRFCHKTRNEGSCQFPLQLRWHSWSCDQRTLGRSWQRAVGGSLAVPGAGATVARFARCAFQTPVPARLPPRFFLQLAALVQKGFNHQLQGSLN